MEKEKCNIKMSKFLVSVYEPEQLIQISEFDETFYRLNSVSDVYIDEVVVKINVKMEFVKDCLMTVCGNLNEVVESDVSVALCGEVPEQILCRQAIGVQLDRNRQDQEASVVFSASARDLRNHSHCVLIVRDERSQKTLGKHQINLYDKKTSALHPLDWYEVVSSFLLRPGDSEPVMYKIIASEENTMCRVRFNLRVSADMLWRMPELEIRMYYKNGQVTSEYCQLRKDALDEGCDRYHVEHDFFVSNERSGDTYAELWCVGYRITGLIFSTSDPTVYGIWSYDQMGYVADYNPKIAQEHLLVLYADLYGTDLGYSYEDTRFGIDDESTEKMPTLPERTRELVDGYLDDIGLSWRDEEAEEKEEEHSGNDYYGRAEERSSEEMLARMVGIYDVKTKLECFKKVVQFNEMRRKSYLPTMSMPLHAMFLGSPGTGKTTVAKAIGEWLASVGVLSKGHVVVRERSTLIGKYYGTEEQSVREALAEAKGGILLIDEAYQLYQECDPKDPGRKAIDALLTALSDESNRDWMLILAGYPKQMMAMFDANPGLRSRIPETNIYKFQDFNEPQLMEIAENYFYANHYVLTDESRLALSARIHEDYIHRGEDFGNARYVMNLIQTEVLPNMAMRVCENPTEAKALEQIEAEDVPMKHYASKPSRVRIGFK